MKKPPQLQSPHPVVGGTLIDGTSASPLPDAVIAIKEDRIVAIGQHDELDYGPDTPVRDLAGATITPDFVDAYTADLADDELRAWTRAGVTTLRELGGHSRPPWIGGEGLRVHRRASGGDYVEASISGALIGSSISRWRNSIVR